MRKKEMRGKTGACGKIETRGKIEVRGGICVTVTAVICLIAACMLWIPETSAGYRSAAEDSQSAGIAGYELKIEVQAAEASVVQNRTCDFGQIISLDNKSQTALAYDIEVSLEEAERWPEGLTVILITESGEKSYGVISDNACVFTDSTWRLEPGERVQGMYGLKLATTYDTDPGDYHFSISSGTYQLD